MLLIGLLVCIIVLQPDFGANAAQEPSLSFSQEPPTTVEFIHTKGAEIPCAAKGISRPTINWTMIDGTPVTSISGLREVSSSDGRLIFHAFRPEKYRPDIHSTVYRCVASNTAGLIISPDVNVHGVILQDSETQVYDTFAADGNTAVFKCHVPAVSAKYLAITAWIKNDNLLIQPMLDDGTNDKYHIMPTGELHIRDVNKGDSGSKYKCKTHNRLTGMSKTSSNAGQLFVTDSQTTQPPRIMDSPPSVTISGGQTAVLACVVQGNPKPRITWYKSIRNKLTPLELGDRFIQAKSVLFIKGTTTSDEGNYVCEATNELGNEKLEVRLTVIGPLLASIQPTFHLAKTDEKVTFDCEATGHPITSVTWYHNGSPIEKQTGKQLVLERVGMADSGMYQCIVKNTAHRVQAAAEMKLSELSPQFVETFDETTVQPGSSVTISCTTSGIPLPKIEWNLHGIPIATSGHIQVFSSVDKDGFALSSLKISKINVKDGGLYSCVATNDVGQAEHAKRINVYGPLGSREVPEKIGVSGRNIILNCPVYGFPIEDIAWMKDDQLLPHAEHQLNFENGSLGIVRVRKNPDSGTYKCMAKAKDGQHTEAFVNVKVMVPPKIVPFEFQDELLREGMRARLQCVISEGDLPLNVTWLKDGRPIPSQLGVLVRVLDEFSSILTISHITPGHNGKYTCVATNQAGRVTHTADLSVNVAPKIVPFNFGDLHYEGSPARVVCGLQEGDAPVRFSWLHNGVPVVIDRSLSVHEVDGLSSILSILNLSANHAGTYTCVAENKAGRTHQQAVLTVHVPPKIVPFTFQEEHLVEGLLARVSCVVSRGDLPLSLQWEKDDVEIVLGAEGVQIRSFDEYSSVISIASVSPRNNGRYTCIAKNAAGTARHSAQLTVKVPPRWLTSPESIEAMKGQDIWLHCQADGFPKPEIIWLQAKNTKHQTTRKRIYSSSSTLIYPNGTLLLQNIDHVNQGFYICRASNGIGNEISVIVEVKINAPPLFKEIQSETDAAIGKEVQLRCWVHGDAPLKIMWYKDGKVQQNKQARQKIETTNSSSDAVSLLKISKVSRNDQGFYECHAENRYGSNKTMIKLIVKSLPDPPTDAKIVSSNSRSVELNWKSPFDGNEHIQKYVIQYKKAEDSWDKATSTETANGQPTNCIVSDLDPATNYLFRLFAENSQGLSSASPILRITTNDDIPSGPPRNVEVESVNTETFKVSWKAPDEKLWNGKIQGFYVGYKEVDTEDPYLFKTLLTQDPTADDLYVQIGGLKQFTKYAVIVQAYNSQGKGPESEPVIVMTSEGAPSLPPTDVRCTTLTSQSIHLTWTAPPSDSINGILRGYKVLYRQATEWLEDLAENYNVTLPTSLTLHQLEKYTNYSIQVLAMTKTAEGPRSNTVFCKTLDDVPGSPTDIKTIATSDDSVIMAWKEPDNPNGILKSYTVYWKNVNDVKDAGSHSVPARDHSYEVTGLKKGVQYEFWVAASTMIIKNQHDVLNVLPLLLPECHDVAARVVSFDAKIVTAWKSDVLLQCQSVGLPEPQKKWMWKEKQIDGSGNAKILADGNLSLNNVREEDAGDYTCQVQNDFGQDKITYNIIVLAPPAAPMLEITSITSSAIEIQWKVPSSKMSRIKGYTLHTRKDAVEWKEVILGADTRSYRLNSLDCGTRYELYMTAFNKIGVGAPSEVLLISTNGSVPTPPNKFDLIEEATTSVSLYLNTWKSNGCPVLYYMVEYSPKSSNEWTFVSTNIKPEQRRLVIPGLKSGTWYGLRMTAHNSAGSAVAEYNFATLTATGATIPPDLMSDSAGDPMDSLMSYLNFYIVVPIICTAIILLAILGAACFYLKIKGREQDRSSENSIPPPPPIGTLKRGNSSESFAYMQRGTLQRARGHSGHHDDLTPYATFQLANQCNANPLGKNSDSAPPLPPPRIEGFQNVIPPPVNLHFYPGIPDQNMTETTFVFPNIQGDNGMHFSGYPNEMPK